ncbi:MAG: hypothetical protein WAV56_00415 [Microgenomates group bacterium]
MLTVETARTTEIRNSFAEAALLVPITMRLVLVEEAEEFDEWGNDFHGVSMMLAKIGVNSLVATEQVMEMIKAGKRGVWGIGEKSRFEAMVERVVGKSGSETEIEYWRTRLIGLAMKTTVMAMVGGSRAEYERQLVLLKFMQKEPEVLAELLGQLGVSLSRGERDRLTELLKKVDLDS